MFSFSRRKSGGSVSLPVAKAEPAASPVAARVSLSSPAVNVYPAESPIVRQPSPVVAARQEGSPIVRQPSPVVAARPEASPIVRQPSPVVAARLNGGYPEANSKPVATPAAYSSVRDGQAHVTKIAQATELHAEMKTRHTDLFQVLQDNIGAQHEEELQEREQMHEEINQLKESLGSRESSERQFEEIRNEQLRQMAEMAEMMSQAINKEFEQMRNQSTEHSEIIKEAVGKHAGNADAERERSLVIVKEHSARADGLQVKHEEAVAGQRDAEQEVATLRERLAAVEERARQAEERQREMADVNTQLAKVRQDNIQDLNAHHESVKKHVMDVVVEHSAKHVEKHSAKIDSWKADVEAGVETQRKVEIENAELRARVNGAEDRVKSLQSERDAGLQREEALRVQAAHDLKRAAEERDEAKTREAELMHMLNEVQDSIITASTTGVATPGAPPTPPHWGRRLMMSREVSAS